MSFNKEILALFAPWRSHKPVRITKSPITGKSFIAPGQIYYPLKYFSKNVMNTFHVFASKSLAEFL